MDENEPLLEESIQVQGSCFLPFRAELEKAWGILFLNAMELKAFDLSHNTGASGRKQTEPSTKAHGICPVEYDSKILNLCSPHTGIHQPRYQKRCLH